MKKLAWLALAFLALAGLRSDANAVTVQNCDATERGLVLAAYGYVRDNLSELKSFDLARRAGRERRIKRRMDRKIGRLKINCRSGVICRGDDTHGAAPTGRLGTRIRLCITNLEGSSARFCQVVETIAHEFAHVVGVARDNFGAHGRNQSDRVYRFGFFARDLCRRDTRTYIKPAIPVRGLTVRLDWCHRWAQDCGAPAAEAFCQRNGHPRLSFYQKAENVGKTAVLVSSRICNDPNCDSFERIVCAR